MTHPTDTPLALVIKNANTRTINDHPDLAQLDIYLDWLYGDGPAPEGIKDLT